VVTEKNVLIVSMHEPGKPDVRLICGDYSDGDRVPPRRQSTAQPQRVGDDGPSADDYIGNRRLMDLPCGTKGPATRRDAREPGGRRDGVSRDINRGVALSARTSTTAPIRANDSFKWPRTYVNSNTARMKPCRRNAIRVRTVTEY
jgi:hypothetical protein